MGYAPFDSLIVETSRSSITNKDENVLSKEIKVSRNLAIQNFKDKNKDGFISMLRSNNLGNPKPTKTPQVIEMQDSKDNDDSNNTDPELSIDDPIPKKKKKKVEKKSTRVDTTA